MLILLLLFILLLVFFFVIKFAAVVTAMVAVTVSVTTISILACVWMGTSYYLKETGYEPKAARKSYHQVDSGLKEISEDLQQIRSQLADVEPHLRNLEFLKYASQNTEVKKSET